MKRIVLLVITLWCLCSLRGQNYNMSNGTVTISCPQTVHFYDPGGPSGNYENSLNITQTFVSSDPSKCLRVTFSSFHLESATWDYLKIYNGTNSSASLVGSFGGTTSPGVITSTTGALTFVFHSDGTVNYDGWSATITCVECSASPDQPGDCIPQSTSSGSPCSQQTAASPFCTDENPYGITYPSGTGSNSASPFLGQSDISCLFTTPRPAWYYMQISTPGDLLIYIQQTSTTGAGLDVDFACWGPFEAANQTDFVDNLCCGVYNLNDISHGSHRPTDGVHQGNMGGYPDGNVVDCSYSAQSTEWCFIPNAQQGQWYLLLITNYNGGAGTITFSPVSAYSNATTNCSLLAPMTYNSPLCEGDTMVLTCENPQSGATYHWSGPGGWTATTSVPTVSIPNVTVAQTGQYSLQLTGSGITVTPSQIEVTVNAMPQVTMTASADTICRGTQVTLQASGAASYSWSPSGSGATRTFSPTTTTTYTVTGSNSGCAATASLTVVVHPRPTVTISANPTNRAICRGDTATLYATGGESYEWLQGTTVIGTDDSVSVSPNSSTSYRVVVTSSEGCTNSATSSITVRALPTVSISGAHGICQGDSVQLTSSSASQYEWNTGATTRTIWVHPDVTSDYTVTVTNNYGCTASDTVQVRVFLSDTSTYRDTVCWNSVFQDANFSLTEILAPGNHQFSTTYQTSASCDSVVILDLTVLPMMPVVMYDTACVSYQWRNNTYMQTGVYIDSVLDAHACLQVDTLHLTIRDAYETIDTVTACESYTWINGQTYTESTETPSYTMIASSLCDSIIHLHLTVYHAIHEVIEKDTCSFYTWHGTRYTQSGIFTFSSNDEHACPYTDTLLLSLHFASPASMNTQACDSYEWNGTVYTESGVYTHGHADANGCWQVDTLHLTINRAVHDSQTHTACESYEWHGTTYTQSGVYMYALNDEHGCMQVDTLHLTVHHAEGTSERVIVCEPYSWHNAQYDASGVYLYNYNDVHGCPCADTLHLRVTSEPELLLEEVINATCNQDNGSIKVSPSGGTQPYRYVFQPSGVEAEFNHLAVGNYHLQMIDSIGCTAEAEFTIDNIIHHVSLVQVTDAHCGRADGMVEIAATGGFGMYTYQWVSPIVSDGPVAEQVAAGNYSVAVVDSNGCSLTLAFTVRDIPGPDACFYFSMSNEKSVIMVNCTAEEGLIHWNWNFGDGQGSTEWQPTHTYSDPGQYPVVLTVVDDNNCLDSLSLLYVIHEVPTMYLPSAFIPESEIAENRVFKPIGNSISEENYEMRIYDRWGQLIFVSRHPENGWDGGINGHLAPQGTYTYQINYVDIEGKPNSRKGSILLLRGGTN
ncbi:MAG: gliding motility-associated C-terminal domain-containing protein [Bacteroidales bacterium]|nr:gliding motility-associated C-terminal domain-containing protein [Bacteroidales bacterium]